MALQILYTSLKEPVGLYDYKANETFEGGMIGQLENEVGAGGYAESPTDYKVVVAKASDPDATERRVLGVIDDSTTGAGYGTLLGDQLLAGVREQSISQSTALASGKCSLWITPGIYATDQYASIEVGVLIAVGTALYATGGKITDDSAGLSNTKVIGAFIEFQTSQAMGIRVSPAEPDKIWAVFKFDPYME